jgi:hypothetical protein
MSNALKGVVTVALIAGAFCSAFFLPGEAVMKDTFLALLSAIWVVPPVARALGMKV